MDKQLKRVQFFNIMLNEMLTDYETEGKRIGQFMVDKPTYKRWELPIRTVNKADLKRTMLMLRKETIKLEKSFLEITT